MRIFTITSAVLFLVAATATTASAHQETALQRCSAGAYPSTCPKDHYCLAAKPHSYCTKKLDGRRVCLRDAECRSGVCFVAKERHGKRVCASLPLKDYPLGAQCTQSTQCKDNFCDKGYCKKPVGAGEKCPKEVGCADLDKGAHCLNKPATFVVYTSAGKKQTKKLSAGRCSYVSNLGEGMKCSSNANCYGEQFTCSKKTKTCTAKAAPSKLPYDEACSASAQCASGACVSGKCGCKAGGSDCSDTEVCASDSTCQAKLPYDSLCEDNNQCLSNSCINPRASRRSPSPFYKSCGCTASDQCPGSDVCDRGTNTCQAPIPTGLPYQTPCETSDECASGACVSGKCGCGSDSECPSIDGIGSYCNTDFYVCDQKSAYDYQCRFDTGCLSGKCLGETCGCSVDADCPNEGDVCTSDHTCYTPEPTNLPYQALCNQDSACASNACVLGDPRGFTCGCTIGGSDCSTSEYCSLDNHCTKKSFGQPCTPGQDDTCFSNHCIADSATCGCGSDSDCPSIDGIDSYCKTEFGVCKQKNAYDEQCSSGSTCQSGMCRGETCGCWNNADCPNQGDVCWGDNTCH